MLGFIKTIQSRGYKIKERRKLMNQILDILIYSSSIILFGSLIIKFILTKI